MSPGTFSLLSWVVLSGGRRISPPHDLGLYSLRWPACNVLCVTHRKEVGFPMVCLPSTMFGLCKQSQGPRRHVSHDRLNQATITHCLCTGGALESRGGAVASETESHGGEPAGLAPPLMFLCQWGSYSARKGPVFFQLQGRSQLLALLLLLILPPSLTHTFHTPKGSTVASSLTPL